MRRLDSACLDAPSMLEGCVMRFFFNVIDGRNIIDDVGYEFVSLSAAKCEAVAYAGKLICDEANTFWNHGDWQMQVTDETGLMLFTLMFAGYDSAATIQSKIL